MKYEVKKNTHYDFDIDNNAISSNDVTGLIPAKPHSQDEYEAYNEIVNFEPPFTYYMDEKNRKNDWNGAEKKKK